jgi:hypothetical protein
LIPFSSPNYKSDIFSKNHVSGTARKIGVTFIWWFTVQGHDDIRFKASDNAEDVKLAFIPGMQNEIRTILDAVHQAYIRSTSDSFDR